MKLKYNERLTLYFGEGYSHKIFCHAKSFQAVQKEFSHRDIHFVVQLSACIGDDGDASMYDSKAKTCKYLRFNL